MKNRYYIPLIVICLIQVFIGIYFGMQKMNFHMDEIFTYALSNHTNGTKFEFPQGQLTDNSILKNYVIVPEDGRFKYNKVWQNQASDVHPPMYYIIIHTLCSLWPGKYLVWGGLGLNLILSVLSTVLLYFISRHFLKNNILALLLASVWAFSFGHITFVVFIRMYMFLTVWILAITLLHLSYFKKSLDITFYSLLVLLSVFGTLTHYYFLIYIFFLCLFFTIKLLAARQFKEVLIYLFSLGIAGITSVIIFSPMLKHIFLGNRGTQSFNNFANTSDTAYRLERYFNIISHQLFYDLLYALLFIAMAMLLYTILKNNKDIINVNYKFITGILLSDLSMIMFACLGYFLIVSKISVYIVDRYMVAIYPLVILVVVLVFINLTKFCTSNKIVPHIVCIFFIFLSLTGLWKNDIFYLYKDTQKVIDIAKENSDLPCLVVYDADWKLTAYYLELTNYKQLIFVSKDNLHLLRALNKYDRLIAYLILTDDFIISPDNKVILDTLLEVNKGLEKYDEEFSSEYAITYLLE